jgi:hypothetical protein
MRGSRTLAQDRVSPLWHIFDLHARHGAVMALEAPKYNRAWRQVSKPAVQAAANEIAARVI